MERLTDETEPGENLLMMITRSIALLCSFILPVSVPACGDQREELFYSTQLPLRVLHAKTHGLPTEAIDYEAAVKNRSLFDSEEAEGSANSEIFFERSGCLGICPSDTMRLLRNGKAYYWGEGNVTKQGCYRADTPIEAFRVLSVVVDEIRLWDMQDTYAVLDTDAASAYTAVRRGNERKVIWNYSNSGPVELWLFEEFLQKLTVDFEWKALKGIESAAECLGLDSPDSE